MLFVFKSKSNAFTPRVEVKNFFFHIKIKIDDYLYTEKEALVFQHLAGIDSCVQVKWNCLEVIDIASFAFSLKVSLLISC